MFNVYKRFHPGSRKTSRKAVHLELAFLFPPAPGLQGWLLQLWHCKPLQEAQTQTPAQSLPQTQGYRNTQRGLWTKLLRSVRLNLYKGNFQKQNFNDAVSPQVAPSRNTIHGRGRLASGGYSSTSLIQDIPATAWFSFSTSVIKTQSCLSHSKAQSFRLLLLPNSVEKWTRANTAYRGEEHTVLRSLGVFLPPSFCQVNVL